MRGGTVTDVLTVARRELGVTEHPMGSNRQPYASVAGHADGQPWCATFVVAVGRRAGVTMGNESAYTPSLYASLRKVQRSEVRSGDLVFFHYPSKGRIAHVGIVERVEADCLVTIEGNTDAAGGRTGGRVMRKKRAYTGTFFARPEYRERVPSPRQGQDPVLCQGDRGQCVLNVQNALRKDGSRVQPTAVFDVPTVHAVRSFQQRHGLVVDGVVGPRTWAALRAVAHGRAAAGVRV